MRAITLISAALFLVGCADPNINFGNEDFHVVVQSGGTASAEGTVGHTSPATEELKRVVIDPTVHWKPSITTYVPTIVFRNADIEVLLQPQTMILESNDGSGHFSQWVAPIQTSEFEKIRSLAIKDIGARAKK